MRRRLPSLNALKAFEASARQESFTQAANELCVTQGAVSQQVKALESELGVRLFRRERQRLIITEAGRTYLEVVRDAFDRLAAGTERLLQREQSGTLTITTSPNFAAKWLVHRLGRFSETHPGIDLRVSASVQHIDFAREDIDLAIRHGDGQWPGMHVIRLCTEELFPVCSPKLLKGRGALRLLRDVKHHTLLHTNDTNNWENWLARVDARVGVGGVDAKRRRQAWNHLQSGQHGNRCRSRWSGHRTGAHGARLLGLDLRASRPAIPASVRRTVCVLDRLSQINGGAAEDIGFSRLAAERGGKRCPVYHRD